MVYGEDQEPAPGHTELLPVLWEMDILPDVRVLPALPWWEIDLPQTREAAVQLAVEGSWLRPADVERARTVIDERFEELFTPGAQGYRPLWRGYMRELLITWEPAHAGQG